MKVLTIGTFDLLHLGHINFLHRCAELGYLVVGVNTDEFVTTFKERPILDFHERLSGIESLGYVATRNDSPGRKLIEKVDPDFLIVGSDWARKDYYTQIDMTQDLFDKLDIGVIYLPRTTGLMPPMSSTEIKRRIREN